MGNTYNKTIIEL